jgi:hypothetical protein
MGGERHIRLMIIACGPIEGMNLGPAHRKGFGNGPADTSCSAGDEGDAP